MINFYHRFFANCAEVAASLAALTEDRQPLAFFSKALHPTERRYSTFGRELLVVYLSVKHSRYCVEGGRLIIIIDHKPLISAMASLSSKYRGWNQEYFVPQNLVESDASMGTCKWICYLCHDDKQSTRFQMTYDTTFCQDVNIIPGFATSYNRNLKK